MPFTGVQSTTGDMRCMEERDKPIRDWVHGGERWIDSRFGVDSWWIKKESDPSCQGVLLSCYCAYSFCVRPTPLWPRSLFLLFEYVSLSPPCIDTLLEMPGLSGIQWGAGVCLRNATQKREIRGSKKRDRPVKNTGSEYSARKNTLLISNRNLQFSPGFFPYFSNFLKIRYFHP